MSLSLDLFGLLQEEIQPALGCTEPAAVALACALAAHHLSGPITKVTVSTDPNVYKNGMGVYIPGTDKTGLLWASALGALSARPEQELQLLAGCDQYLEQAAHLIGAGAISVSPGQPKGRLSITARVENEENYAIAEILGSHSHLHHLSVNGETIWQEEDALAAAPGISASDLAAFPLRELVAACDQLPGAAYRYVLECARANQRVSNAGLAQNLGLGLGWHYQQLMQDKLLGEDLANQAMAATAAAADARMSGWDEPVFSTNGSGNQGITASVPVLTVGEALARTDQEIALALAISQVVTIYVKQHIGKLSALCACAVAAAIGATCGVSQLLGEPFETMSEAIKIMVANLTGIICDGAKVSCSIKLATAASTAVQAALLAQAGLAAPLADGIIADTVEETIRNLGTISNPGMVETDRVILDVMMQGKKNCRC
jgi:L-cysteine desulfidase